VRHCSDGDPFWVEVFTKLNALEMEIENVVSHTTVCHGYVVTNSMEALCNMRELCYSIDAPENMYNIILIKVGAPQCFCFRVYCDYIKLTFAAPFHFTRFQTKSNRFLKMVA